MQRLLALSFVLIVLLLTGCVHYNEYLSLDRQGSGTLTFKMGIMDMGPMFGEELGALDDSEDDYEDQDESFLGGIDDYDEYPGITIVETKTYSHEGMEWEEVTIEFESLAVLRQALGDGFFLMGQASFEEEDGYLIFRRVLPALNANFEDELSEDFGEEIPLEMFYPLFQDINWVYEVRFPGKIVESNAQDEEIDLKTNSIRWSHQLTDLLSEETEMWAKIRL